MSTARLLLLAAGLLYQTAWASDAMGGLALDAVRARTQYIHHCSGCHLADGSGSPDKGVPSMRRDLGQFLHTPGGREFIVQVPGVMNSPLSDHDIANLMNWLLPYVSSATMPEGTPAYSAAEIENLRKTRPLDVMAVRRGLIGALIKSGIAIGGTPATLP